MKKYGLLLAKVGYCVVVAGLLTGAGIVGSQRLREQSAFDAPPSGVAPGRTAKFLDTSDVESAPAPTKAVVYVTGSVKKPGLYELPLGKRVVDAIQAAGGPTGAADLEGVNLAQKLTDGTQVTVPARSGNRPRVEIHVPTPDGRALTAPGRTAKPEEGREAVRRDRVAYR